MRAIAIDKVTLALPEVPAFFKAFGYHQTGKGLTCLNVEMACAFHVLSRAPFAWVCDRACTSEITLMGRLLKYLKAKPEDDDKNDTKKDKKKDKKGKKKWKKGKKGKKGKRARPGATPQADLPGLPQLPSLPGKG